MKLARYLLCAAVKGSGGHLKRTFVGGRLLSGSKFLAECEPYKRIVAIAIPSDFRSLLPDDVDAKKTNENDKPCANCIGISQTNFYHSLAEPKSVAMVREKTGVPPYATIARQLLRIAKEEKRLAGVLFITTERGAVRESDAERFKDGVIKEAKELQRQQREQQGTAEGGEGTCLLENVPMGFSDVEDEREGSWRELGNAREEEEGESWAPAAARASARRLRTFLEKEQGALNTFG